MVSLAIINDIAVMIVYFLFVIISMLIINNNIHSELAFRLSIRPNFKDSIGIEVFLGFISPGVGMVISLLLFFIFWGIFLFSFMYFTEFIS